jgi:hypothetical protein
MLLAPPVKQNNLMWRRSVVRTFVYGVGCFLVLKLGVGISTAQETDGIEMGKHEYQRS